VTTAETLAAAALMREQHGEGCPDQQFWAATADVLDEAHADAAAVEAASGRHVLGDGTARPLRVALAYLATQRGEFDYQGGETTP
jgi:hypothetical protein